LHRDPHRTEPRPDGETLRRQTRVPAATTCWRSAYYGPGTLTTIAAHLATIDAALVASGNAPVADARPDDASTVTAKVTPRLGDTERTSHFGAGASLFVIALGLARRVRRR